MDRVHAFDDDDALGAHDTLGLVEELRARRVSASELVEAAVRRTQQVDPDLAAVAYAGFDRARAQARTPSPGLFSGVPTFVKDNADVEGWPTQHGTRSFVARPARADGGVARMFAALGLVPLGKSRLSEFGFSPSAEYVDDPPVRNPWQTDHVSGASSAGSAVLVATGAVPLAHANDGGGSIRIPAACTGLVGLKPTRGRTPGERTSQQMPVRLVADGVLTRSVRDTAAYLRESEKVFRDLDLPPVGDIRGPGTKRLRVGLVTTSVGGRGTDAETLAVVQATAALLEELGHHVEQAQAPVADSFTEDFLDYWALLAGTVVTTGRLTLDRRFDRSRLDNLTRGLAARAARHSWRLPLAAARLAASSRRSARFFERHDVVLTPTLGHVTPEIGLLDPTQPYEQVLEALLDWVSFTPLQNATGDPAISLPLGSSAAGLPIGVQLAAGRGHEATLLELAYELEAARPFPRIHAPTCE